MAVDRRSDLTKRFGARPKDARRYSVIGRASEEWGEMKNPFIAPPPELVQKIRDIHERRLSPEEFQVYVDAPMADQERNAIAELIGWFQRRYPRPLDRLISARRTYARAAR